MAMIVRVEDTDDPYGRTGTATQQADGSWSIEYHQRGELLALHTMYDMLAEPIDDDGTPPTALDQDEADIALYMCEILADPGQFAGTFPDPGYQRNRQVWPANVCTLCFESRDVHDTTTTTDDHPFTPPAPTTVDAGPRG